MQRYLGHRRSLENWRESDLRVQAPSSSAGPLKQQDRQPESGAGDCLRRDAPSPSLDFAMSCPSRGECEEEVQTKRRMTWTSTFDESEPGEMQQVLGEPGEVHRCASLTEPCHRRATDPHDETQVAAKGETHVAPHAARLSSDGSQRRVSNDSIFSIKRTESDPLSQNSDHSKSFNFLPLEDLKDEHGRMTNEAFASMQSGRLPRHSSEWRAPMEGGGNGSLSCLGSPLLGALSHLRKKDKRGSPKANSAWPVSVSPTWGSFSRVHGNDSVGKKIVPKLTSAMPDPDDEGSTPTSMRVGIPSPTSMRVGIPSPTSMRLGIPSSPCPIDSPWSKSWHKTSAVSEKPLRSSSAEFSVGRDTTANWLGGQERWDALGISLINAKVIASGLLRKNTQRIAWAMEWTSPSAVLFTSIPLDAMHTRWQFSALLWMRAIYLCYYASSAATSLHAQSALPISQFRLTVNQTRGQCHARDFKAPSVAFSLAGRRISAAKFNVEWEFKGGMPTAVASFAEGVKISAWSFTTADGSNPSCDPILFSAQRFVETKRGAGAGAGAEAGWGINSSRCGNEEDGTCGAGDTCSSRSHNLCGEWVELRQPGWMSNKQLSSEEMVRSGAAQVSVERQSEAYFDMSPPMSKYCEMWGCIIEAALSLAAIFLMAVLQKFAVGRVLMALSAASWIPLILACQPWSASQMSYESVALLPWCALTAFGVLNQRYFSYASPIAAIYYCTVTCLWNKVHINAAEHMRGIVSATFWAYILICRFFDKRRAISIVADDHREYDKAWNYILQDGNSRKWLDRLDKLSMRIEISCKGKTTHQTVPAADEMLMDYHSQETEAPDRKTEPSGGFEAGMRREFSTESLEGMDHSGLIKFRGWNVEDEAPLVRLARPCTNVESPRASVNFTPDAALPHFSRSRSFNSNASDKFAAMRSSPSTPIISNLSSTSRGVGVSSPVFQPRSPKQHDSLELGPPALVGHSSSTYSTSGLAPEALQRVESSDSVVSEIFCVLNERMDYQVEPLCGAESTDSLSNSAAATGSFASDDLPLDGNVPEIEGSFAKLGNRLAHAESFIRSMVKDTTDGSRLQSKTMCIDELYIHAPFIDYLLRRKIQIWGCSFGGMYRSQQGGFRKWDSAAVLDNSNVLWCGIKHLDRSVEKILRVYDGDVSQLLDVCRQCIVFENVKDLHNCLMGIWQDSDVEIVRIKNRLSPLYDSSVTAGYRDVAINIAITPPDMSGVIDTHICEVQLVLKSTSELKSGEGHKRYIEFRNMRGE